MKNIARDCVSEEVAHMLQAAKWEPQEPCQMIWGLYPVNDKGDAPTQLVLNTPNNKSIVNDWIYAPTATQLFDELPHLLHSKDPEHPMHQLIVEKQHTQYHAVYVCTKCFGKLHPQLADTLPNALGKMMAFLEGNKLL